MILEPGIKVLVAHRRLFETDHTRFFTGTVEGYEDGIARITGHSWLRDPYKGALERKDDQRTKLISLSSGTVILYQLPSDVDMKKLTFEIEGVHLLLRDGAGFSMDLSEGVFQGAESLAGRIRKRIA